MSQYYSDTCLCQSPPPVSNHTKKQICHAIQPLAQKYCDKSKHPKECANMARVHCLNSHNSKELFNYMWTITNKTGACPPPCKCNYWK